MTVALDPRPQCSEHPDQLAVKTCPRCGGFMCQGCGLAELCAACGRLALQTLPSSQRRAATAVAFLWIAGACDAGWALMSLWTYASPGENLARDLFGGVVGLGLVVGMLGAAIAFAMWEHRVVRQLSGMNVDVGVTPGWAVGYWFVPILHLWRPYQVIKRIATALGGTALATQLQLGLWWTVWIGGSFLDNAETQLAGGLTNWTDTPASLGLGIASGIAGALGAAMCVRIVRGLQRQVAARREAGGPQPSFA